MTSQLPRSVPTAQRVDPRALSTLINALEAQSGIEMHSLMVLRHG